MIKFSFDSKRRSDFTFCEDQKVVREKLTLMNLCEIQDEDRDGELCIDTNGQKWELYEYDDFDTFRKPYEKGIRVFPYPSLDAIISIVCNSLYDDEIKGACRLLLENEWKVEFREKLLDEIEKREIHKNVEKYNIIYESANLASQINERGVINKKIEEIEVDYNYYMDLAKRALRLKNEHQK